MAALQGLRGEKQVSGRNCCGEARTAEGCLERQEMQGQQRCRMSRRKSGDERETRADEETCPGNMLRRVEIKKGVRNTAL